MLKILKIFYLIRNFFVISTAPIGLSSLGLKSNYLKGINNFNYNNLKFNIVILSPVKNPYFLINHS